MKAQKLKLIIRKVTRQEIAHQEVAEKARALRLARKLRLEDMAKRLGWSIGYVCDLENARRRWNEEKVSLWNAALEAA